ncbi:PqqD family protein [Terrabacter sp. 2TAF16]|uniref:PqqD family protein n=1 Tax=unclassified Terrabacter TaxID=2630222 RepID=UPI003F985017
MSMVWAVEALDELIGEDGSVVLIPVNGAYRVVRLSTLGQAVRELTAGGTSIEQLASGLVARFGTPPERADSRDAVRAVLASLESEGVVRLDG